MAASCGAGAMLLEVENLGKSYGGVRALEAVSFAVGEGDLVGIMGANGAGKTTLFSLIAGNARPTSGAIRFEGKRLDGLRPDQVSRRGIARTFQIVRPLRGLSVLENVATGALFGASRERSRGAARERALAILAEMGLADRADAPAGDLTLAGQKRLEVARALATRPKLLMLDEVLAGLTPAEVAEALDLVRALRRRHHLAILVIEHVMDVLMRLSERVIVLHHGRLIAQGPPAEIAASPAVIEAYLGRRP
jgi:branched-chain amino acid transport system ATP-binding protein